MSTLRLTDFVETFTHLLLLVGLSCGNCSQGFMRPSLAANLYSSCVACTCNQRTDTLIPICDQWTGVCLNCRNGSMGQHCENCSAFVDPGSFGCDLCINRYWAISKTGCISKKR